jgi:hypothetical protein
MTDQRCAHCETTMTKRKGARYCSGACRAAASRARRESAKVTELLARIDALRAEIAGGAK